MNASFIPSLNPLNFSLAVPLLLVLDLLEVLLLLGEGSMT